MQGETAGLLYVQKEMGSFLLHGYHSFNACLSVGMHFSEWLCEKIIFPVFLEGFKFNDSSDI